MAACGVVGVADDVDDAAAVGWFCWTAPNDMICRADALLSRSVWDAEGRTTGRGAVLAPMMLPMLVPVLLLLLLGVVVVIVVGCCCVCCCC